MVPFFAVLDDDLGLLAVLAQDTARTHVYQGCLSALLLVKSDEWI